MSRLSRFARVHPYAFITLLLACLAASFLIALMVGYVGPIGWSSDSSHISFADFFAVISGGGSGWAHSLIMEVRLPKILLAAGVGGCLGVSGLLMQGLFKNPLAEPFILGSSAGASVGAALVIAAGTSTIPVLGALLTNSTGLYGILPAVAFIGALLTSLFVYIIARRGGRVDTFTLILAGVAINTFLSSVVMFVMLRLEDKNQLFFWLLGSFDEATLLQSVIVINILVVVIILSFPLMRSLDILQLSPEEASSLGVNVERLKILLIVLSTMLVGAAIAFAGIIGFVGLITPHVMRIVMGPSHRPLLISTAIAGAIFCTLAHALAHLVIAPVVLPLGVITAFCGAPFFIYLLRRRIRKGVYV